MNEIALRSIPFRYPDVGRTLEAGEHASILINPKPGTLSRARTVARLSLTTRKPRCLLIYQWQAYRGLGTLQLDGGREVLGPRRFLADIPKDSLPWSDFHCQSSPSV